MCSKPAKGIKKVLNSLITANKIIETQKCAAVTEHRDSAGAQARANAV